MKNGDAKSYNLNRPRTLEEFRSMPQDLQIMYIKKLLDIDGQITTDELSKLLKSKDII